MLNFAELRLQISLDSRHWLGVQFSDKLILSKAEIKQIKKKSLIKNLIRRVRGKTISLFPFRQINNNNIIITLYR